MLYQIEMVDNQYVYFTIDLELLEFLQSEEGCKYIGNLERTYKERLAGIFFYQFPTYILKDNKVHFRHWSIKRRLKNLKELGDKFTTTGMNLDPCDLIKELKYVYTFY